MVRGGTIAVFVVGSGVTVTRDAGSLLLGGTVMVFVAGGGVTVTTGGCADDG